MAKKKPKKKKEDLAEKSLDEIVGALLKVPPKDDKKPKK